MKTNTLGRPSQAHKQAAQVVKKKEADVTLEHTRRISISYALIAVLMSVGSFVWICTTYRFENMLFVLLLFLTFGAIAVFSWLASILSIERFQGWTSFSGSEIFSLVLYLLSCLIAFCASLAASRQNSVGQFTLSFFSSFLWWLGFMVVFHNSVRLPTRQQLGALAHTIVLSVLWELRTFFTIRLSDDVAYS